MQGWLADKAWSDCFIERIKEIIGRALIVAAPVEDDQLYNTDLLMLRCDSVRIACRIRRYEYHKRFSHEFTIRCTRPSNNKTELEKILEGYGDYFLYGFANEQQDDIAHWTLCNLAVFRGWYWLRELRCSADLGIRQKNVDGSSDFRVFRWDEFPMNFVVDTSSVDNRLFV